MIFSVKADADTIRKLTQISQDHVVGLTSGCFDLLHYLHYDYLRRCRDLCDILIVGVDSDFRVREIKGNGRPIIPCSHRMEMVNALKPVSLVFEMNNLDDFETVKIIWNVKKIFKNQFFKDRKVIGVDNKCELVIVPDLNLPDSTSSIIEDVIRRRNQVEEKPQEEDEAKFSYPKKSERKLGQILLERKYLDKPIVQAQLDSALEFQKKSGNNLRIGEILVKWNFCSQKDVLMCLALQYDIPFVEEIEKIVPQVAAIEAIPLSIAECNNILPLEKHEGSLTVAMSDICFEVLGELHFLLEQDISPVLALPDKIKKAIKHYYGTCRTID